jgi:hypothetical protein
LVSTRILTTHFRPELFNPPFCILQILIPVHCHCYVLVLAYIALADSLNEAVHHLLCSLLRPPCTHISRFLQSKPHYKVVLQLKVMDCLIVPTLFDHFKSQKTSGSYRKMSDNSRNKQPDIQNLGMEHRTRVMGDMKFHLMTGHRWWYRKSAAVDFHYIAGVFL